MKLTLAFSLIGAATAHDRPWMNTADPPETRAKKLVAAMTTEEKLSLFHGSCSPGKGGYTGNVCGIDRLGVPQQKFNNGPQGFQSKLHGGTSTTWPSALTVAASFDVNIMKSWGEAMGDEFYRKGANVQLGPGMCLARVPLNGRNFEYLAGEDPYLGYHMAKASVTGIQSQGVIANAKHFINNNQETTRWGFTATVDQRTQFEMYYPPFQGAIDAGVGSIMCSYNRECIDCPKNQTKSMGHWSCENHESLTRDLKGRMGFKGWVMSDWGATHGASINEGLDQEMPGAKKMGDELAQMVKDGEVSMDKVDDSAVRNMWPYFAMGLFDKENTNKDDNNVTSLEHNKLARKYAAASTVLLKNEGVLPISGTKNIVVVGDQAMNPIVHGMGSGRVTPAYTAQPLASINASVGGEAKFVPSNTGNIGAAVKGADVAIVFAATSSEEGEDRDNLSLGSEDTLIQEVAKVLGKKTVVVAVTPGALLTPWRDDVGAIITPFMPGQEYGNAIADILFGEVNPSARLPITFPTKENEMEMTPDMYPGTRDSKGNIVSVYSEGLEVGYRWYNAHKVKPAFAFGHGLSYTQFEYSDLQINQQTRHVSCSVKNIGDVDGAEVPQLYLGFPASAQEPPMQLKGFKRVQLKAGASATVTFFLHTRDFSIWNYSLPTSDDAGWAQWSLVPGEFDVMVGASSEDIRLSGKFSNTEFVAEFVV